MSIDRTMDLLGPGAVIGGRFTIERIVAAGGMGVVYRARDENGGAPVALKLVENASPDVRARFEREARVLASIDHGSVVRYVAHGEMPLGGLYLAMEWLEGEDLQQRLERGRVSLEEAFALGEKVADALRATHGLGLLHRDIKPTNLFLPSGGGVKVLDFGISRAMDASTRITATGVLVGTPGYFAPELLRGEGEPDARADVFALGAVLFECLAGKPAFPGRTAVEVLAQVVGKEPPRLSAVAPGVPEALSRLVAKMLSRSPHDRPASMEAVLGELASVRAEGISARPREAAKATRERTLAMDPALAWAFLIDTNRWNRIVGSSFMRYAIERVDGVNERVGEAELFGSEVRWFERGEWWEGVWGEGERHFLSGPFTVAGLRFRVGHAPGGSRVEAEVYATGRDGGPEGVAAGLCAHFTGKLDRYLDALDALGKTLSDGGSPAIEPAQPLAPLATDLLVGRRPDRVLAGRPPQVDAETLAARLGELTSAGVGEGLVARLRGLVAEAPDDLVRRLRPFALARVWDEAPRDVLRAFLAATRSGLFDLAWDLRCTVCRVRAARAPSLSQTGRTAHCEQCDLDFDVDLAENVEAIFTINAALRSVPDAVYCGGSPILRPHVYASVPVAPGEERIVERPLPSASWVVRCLRPARFEVVDVEEGTRLSVRVSESGLSVERGDGAGITIANTASFPTRIQVERFGADPDAALGVEMLTLPEYLDLFSTDVPSLGKELRVGRIVLALVELHGIAEASARLGDAHVIGVALRHADELAKLAPRASGALVRGLGLVNLVAFRSLPDAVRCFAEASRALAADASAAGIEGLSLRAGASEGASLLVGSGGALDYFGEAAQNAARLLGLAPKRSLALDDAAASERVLGASAAEGLVETRDARAVHLKLRG